MKRKTLLAGLFLVALLGVLVLGVWLILPTAPRVTPATVAQITPGMTVVEVEAILGGPAGNWTGGDCEPIQPVNLSLMAGVPDVYQNARYWTTRTGSARLTFTAEGRVDTAEFLPVLTLRMTLVERVKSWFGCGPPNYVY